MPGRLPTPGVPRVPRVPGDGVGPWLLESWVERRGLLSHGAPTAPKECPLRPRAPRGCRLPAGAGQAAGSSPTPFTLPQTLLPYSRWPGPGPGPTGTGDMQATGDPVLTIPTDFHSQKAFSTQFL